METLNDPFDDRAVKTVKAPPHKPLAPNMMYPDPGKFHDCNIIYCSKTNRTRFGAYQIALVSGRNHCQVGAS